MAHKEKTNEFEIRLSGNETTIEKRQEKQKTRPVSTWYLVGLSGQIGFAIAIPLTLGAIAGAYLDSRWGTKPIATLSGVCIGFILSILGLARIIREILTVTKKP